MKIQTKLIFLLFLIIAAFTIGFVIHLGFEHKRLNSLFDEKKNEEMVTFNKVLDLEGRSLETLAFDYTYWDEMVNAVTTLDKAWFVKLVDTNVLSNYNANAIWIYKTDLTRAYAINNLKDANLEDIPLAKETIKEIFTKEHFCHFFINTSLGLIEIRGATIHSTADAERKTPPQGYFFVGRLWDKDYINGLAAATGNTIALTPTREDFAQKTNLREGIITFSRILTGWDNKPLARLNTSVEVKSIKYFIKTSTQQVSLFLIFAGIILLFVSYVMTRWIGVPLGLISQTLNTENIAYIDEMQKHKTEFGEISRLISKSFKQRQELTEEIVERKQKEEELKEAYDKLRQTQAQLIQASKMSSLGSLASGIAHEINNPLTGVLNNVQLIKMSMVENKDFNANDFKELLDSMEESAQRCVDITRALLDFGRPSKGVLQNFAIKDMIGRVLILVRHQLEMGGIKIARDIESNLPEIKCDPQLLQQAIFDIISNARWAIQKKSKEEGGVITIKARYNPDKDTVDICISDTGIGIPQENLQRLFEPFFTTKGVGEGAGLGLFMVYNIIKEHKGNIEVESEPNQGTTFKISLPVA